MDNLLIVLDPENKKHLYEQIYDHIKKEIREGKLRYGERLPSARLLAQQLQISRSTVDLAYGQLVSEGYLEAKPCQGYFVSHVEELYHITQETDRQQEEVREETDHQQPEENILCDFSPNTIDMSEFPFSTWKRIHRQVLLDEQENVLRKGDPKGDERLRRTIAHYLHASRGVNCSPEQIIIGAGNDYLLLLLQKLFGEVRTVAMENETYLRAYRIFCSNAYRICVTDMDEKGMQVSALEQTEADLAYVMPAHQFPIGAVMPVGRRLELLAWAKEKENRYLIEDDYDSEFRYKGKPIPALQSLDQQEKVIYMGTFSKSIAPAIRVSYLVLPRRLLTLYEQNCSFLSSTVSRIDQAVLNRFIAEGYFERYLNKMRKVYRQKQEKMLECLEPFRNRFTITGEEAGLHMLLTPKDKNVTEQMLIQKAQQQGCKVYGLSDYQIIKKETHRVMLGYASLSLSEIEEGMGLLETAWL